MRELTVAQQGYEGSYHDVVRLRMIPGSRMVGYDDFHSVVCAVDEGAVDVGIMAIENAVYGDTPGALELRRNFDNTEIIGEMVLRITHRLWGADSVDEIRSHPVAIGQCREQIRSRYPLARAVESADTALAAREVSALIERGVTNIAAIAGAQVGALYPNLVQLDSRMNDYPDNDTRFVIFKRKERELDLDFGEAQKTTARLLIPNEKRALLQALTILDAFDIDYTALSANGLRYDSRGGQIVVPMDFLHPWHDERMTDAVNALGQKNMTLTSLGTYAIGKILEV